MPENKKPIPETVGELIAFLKQFPEDYTVDMYTVDIGDNGHEWEASAYWMTVNELKNIKTVEITIK